MSSVIGGGAHRLDGTVHGTCTNLGEKERPWLRQDRCPVRAAETRPSTSCAPRGRTADELGVDTHLGVGPLLPAVRRPGREPLRGVRAARRHGGRHEPGPVRSDGDVLRVPEPEPAGRHGAHDPLVSGGRFILGLGSGWFERDFREYGYEFGTVGEPPARASQHGLPVIKARLAELRPPADEHADPHRRQWRARHLRLVAEHADAWNAFGPPSSFRRKSEVLDDWCADVGRDPAEIERTVAIRPEEVGAIDAYLDAGAQHVIVHDGPAVRPRPGPATARRLSAVALTCLGGRAVRSSPSCADESLGLFLSALLGVLGLAAAACSSGSDDSKVTRTQPSTERDDRRADDRPADDHGEARQRLRVHPGEPARAVGAGHPLARLRAERDVEHRRRDRPEHVRRSSTATRWPGCRSTSCRRMTCRRCT